METSFPIHALGSRLWKVSGDSIVGNAAYLTLYYYTYEVTRVHVVGCVPLQ